MKIKVVYGVDMRLWRYEQEPSYKDLLEYVCKTFEFNDHKQFRITFKDDDDTQTTIASPDDFEDALISAKKQEKKSLKLQIIDSAEKHHQIDEKEEKDSNSKPVPAQNHQNDQNNSYQPSPEEINAFLSDDFAVDLLSDLFVSVFEALQASNFEISFIECVQGIILSSNHKYSKITSNRIWPYFMDELLPKYSHKIETFLIPMMKMSGTINSGMIKQWIPTLLNMMKQHGQYGGDCKRGRGWRGWRGRGRGWRHHGHGRHGRGRHHGRWGHRGHRGRGGWRGRGGFYNPWIHQQHMGFADNMHSQGPHPSAPSMGNQQNMAFDGNMYPPLVSQIGNQQNDDDQIEAEPFEYTEELVAIMNMGFTNMMQIKGLLNKHKGNKQNVVQELVSAK